MNSSCYHIVKHNGLKLNNNINNNQHFYKLLNKRLFNNDTNSMDSSLDNDMKELLALPDASNDDNVEKVTMMKFDAFGPAGFK